MPDAAQGDEDRRNAVRLEFRDGAGAGAAECGTGDGIEMGKLGDDEGGGPI